MRDQARAPSDRTLEVTPQDPWAAPRAPSGPSVGPHGGPGPEGPTVARGAGSPAPPPASPFIRGVAHVKPATPRTEPFTAPHQPTGTGWPGEAEPEIHRPLRWHLAQLRRGGKITTVATLFAFVCWGIWALSGDGDLGTPTLAFLLTLFVAAGLFALSRLVGRLVLEGQLGRVRRSARGAHLVTALFLFGVGVAHLRQTEWVMTGWQWLIGTF